MELDLLPTLRTSVKKKKKKQEKDYGGDHRPVEENPKYKKKQKKGRLYIIL